MTRTSWTPDLDARLLECTEKSIRMGLHPTESPKLKGARNRQLAKSTPFWNAVAILLAESIGPELDECPTPAACAKRYNKALDYWTDPARDSELGRPVAPQDDIIDKLREYDDEWNRCEWMMIEDAHNRMLRAQNLADLLMRDISDLRATLDFDGRLHGVVDDDE
jgi:hypothetical protein